jgi:FtsH-binding integral membrane protein
MTNSSSYAKSSLYNKFFGKNSLSKKGGAKGEELMELIKEKKIFLVSVFANLITQIAITYYVMVNYSKKPPALILLFIVQLILICVIAFVPMPPWLKFILFCIFSFISGIIFSTMNANKEVIKMALVGSMSIFVFMFLIGLALIFFGVFLGTKFAAGLFFSLLLLIIFQIVVIFSGKSPIYQRAIYFISLILFSLYIIYDTNAILQRNYNGDFITASLDYYLDIFNIFIDLIGIDSLND